MKVFSSILLCAILAIGAGCRSTPVASAQKAGIKTIHVEPRIDQDQPMRYGVDLGGGNALAGLIVDSMGKKGVARMSTVMQNNGINLADMIQSHASSHLKKFPELQMADADSDGVFVIKIVQYGFDTPGLKFSRKFPFVVLEAELLDRNGKRIWNGVTTPFQCTSKDIGGTWEEYEADPQKLRSDWDFQVNRITGRLFQVPE